MRRPLATLMALLGFSGIAAAEPPSSHAAPSADLRQMVLHLAPSEIGVSPTSYPHKVWGLLMETGMTKGYYTLVVLADGSTSLYFSNGGGMIGAGEHEHVRSASQQLLAAANNSVTQSTSTTESPTPVHGETRFYFLTFDGLRVYAAPEDRLGTQQDPLSGLFNAGQAVISAIRELPQ